MPRDENNKPRAGEAALSGGTVEVTVVRMNVEWKPKWVAALRSGDYKQGHGSLKLVDPKTGENQYCCLGVLCEVMGICSNTRVFLDQHIAALAGLPPAPTPFGFDRQNVQSDLARMNDGSLGQRKLAFGEIADWIETNL